MRVCVLIVPAGFAVKLRSCPDRSQFDEALDLLKVTVGGAHFDPATRMWLIDSSSGGEFLNWLTMMRTRYSADVEVEESSDPDQPVNVQPPDPLIAAYAQLYLIPDAPFPLVRACYRELAKIHHPDHGGDTGIMQVINEAYERLSGAFKSESERAAK